MIHTAHPLPRKQFSISRLSGSVRGTGIKPIRLSVCLGLCLSFFGVPLAAQDQSSAVSFDVIDENSDGLITKHELNTWRARKFTARDLDNDGAITRGELLKEALDGNRALSWEETADFFMAYDFNGDLEVTYEEVKTIISGSNFFEQMDRDYSGTITHEEAEGWMEIPIDKPQNTSSPTPGPYLNAKPVPAHGEIPQKPMVMPDPDPETEASE